MDESKGITVRHTADKMKAFVSLSGAYGPVTAGEVLTALLHKGVVHGLNTAVIHKFVGLSLFDKFVEVASGTVGTPGADGRVEILVSGFKPLDALPAALTGKSAKSKPLCEFLIVKAGAALARRVPPVLGVTGMDVFGVPMAAPPVKDTALSGGKGTVIMSGDPDTLVAEYGGVFSIGPDGAAEVRPYMEVEGDVTDYLSFDGCVKVAGAVRSGVMVDVTGSMLIMGEVGDAMIKCGGDLSLRGGACSGGGNLTIECGGNVQADRIEGAKLTTEGGVTVAGDIVESAVTAEGALRARRILGGNITAAGGIFATQVGDESKPATVLDVGIVYRYAKERDNAKSGISTQILLAEGYMSELYCYVRDKMDDWGIIPPTVMSGYEQYRKNLADSLAMRRNLEKDVEMLDSRLKEAASCCISANEIYPNVSLRLGFSEQQVREVLKNVCLRPAGIEN
jgi:uncharacterized protein (DUF342 family)